MLCERLTNVSRLAERGYIAEPKLDGQRAQLHVDGGRAVGCFSRRGLDLLEHAGMAWLREIAWPFESAIFDGEACAGNGHEGIQAVFAERKRAGGDMTLVLFDLLHLDGKSVMREPWRAYSILGSTQNQPSSACRRPRSRMSRSSLVFLARRLQSLPSARDFGAARAANRQVTSRASTHAQPV